MQNVRTRNCSSSPRKDGHFPGPRGIQQLGATRAILFTMLFVHVFFFILFPARHPYQIPTIDSIGIDIWTMDKGILFDNIVIDKNPEKVAVNSD